MLSHTNLTHNIECSGPDNRDTTRKPSVSTEDVRTEIGPRYSPEYNPPHNSTFTTASPSTKPTFSPESDPCSRQLVYLRIYIFFFLNWDQFQSENVGGVGGEALHYEVGHPVITASPRFTYFSAKSHIIIIIPPLLSP